MEQQQTDPNALRIAICIPSAGMVNAWFAYSMFGLVGIAGDMKRTRPEMSTVEMTVMLQVTSVIHANREGLVKQALAWNATHILFLDDDMTFDPRVLPMLLSRRHAYVGVNYPKRGFPIDFTAVRMDGKGCIITHKDSTGLEEAFYTGFGVCLIAAEVFQKTPQPWFLPEWIPEQDSYTTEDHPFCKRIRAQGFRCYVDHDASKLVSHNGQIPYSWQQWRPDPVAVAKPVDEVMTPALSAVPVARVA